MPVRLPLLHLCVGAAGGVCLLCLLPQFGSAQLRVYNREQGANVSVPITGGLRAVSATVPDLTVRPPVTPTQMRGGGLRITPVPSTTVVVPSGPQRLSGIRAVTEAAAGVRPRENGLGTALVFIKGSDFSGGISANVRKISRTAGLTSQFYLQDDTPRNLVGMASGSLQNLPQGISFSVDLDSRMAKANEASGKNMIVYRDPSGAVRHYNLVSEFANFLNQIERLRVQ